MRLYSSLVALALGSAAQVEAIVQLQYGRNSRLNWSQRGSQLQRRGAPGVDLYSTGGDEIGYLTANIGTPGEDVQMSLVRFYDITTIPTPNTTYCDATPEECGLMRTYAPRNSSTYKDLGREFHLENGGLPARYFSDKISVGGGAVDVDDFEMVLMEFWDDGAKWCDLGVGPESTFLDRLVKDGTIKTPAFSVWERPRRQGAADGECFAWATTFDGDECHPALDVGTAILGGVDRAKYEGDLLRIDIKAEKTDETRAQGTIWNLGIEMTGMIIVNGKGAKNGTNDGSLTKQVPAFDIWHGGGNGQQNVSYLPRELAETAWEAIGTAPDSSGQTPKPGSVPCDYKPDPQLSISFQFGGECGPVVEFPMEDIVTGRRQPDDKACRLAIQAIFDEEEEEDTSPKGVSSALDSRALLSEMFWRKSYVVYDWANKEMAIARSAADPAEQDLVEFDGLGSKIPGAGKVDPMASKPECKLAEASVGGRNVEKGDDDSMSSHIPIPVYWVLGTVTMTYHFLW